MLWGPGSDQLLASEDAGGVDWTLGDHLGTIRDVVDSTGTLVTHRKYDSFGNLISGATDPGWYVGFTGRFFDLQTGLGYNWQRWFDPKTGRWLSTDPIGFAGGDANLYRYVGNGPTNYTDANGMHYLVPPWDRSRAWSVYAQGQFINQFDPLHRLIVPPPGKSPRFDDWYNAVWPQLRDYYAALDYQAAKAQAQSNIAGGMSAISAEEAARRERNREKDLIFDAFQPENVEYKLAHDARFKVYANYGCMFSPFWTTPWQDIREAWEAQGLVPGTGIAPNLIAAGMSAYHGENQQALASAIGAAIDAAPLFRFRRAAHAPDWDPFFVPGPNPNNLRMRLVSRPTSGEGGVYLKPHMGKTKVGSTDDFCKRYGDNATQGLEIEIPQTRHNKPPNADDSGYPWSARRKRRFDEEYVDRLLNPDVRYRATRPTSPVDPEIWQKYRHIFGYGDLPSNFGR